MAFLIEVIVDVGMDCGELLSRLHLSERYCQTNQHLVRGRDFCLATLRQRQGSTDTIKEQRRSERRSITGHKAG